MRFTERIGLTPTKIELDKTGMTSELRNSLWTVTTELIFDFKSNERNYESYSADREKFSALAVYFRELWIYFFKLPIDSLPISNGRVDKNAAVKFVRE